MLVVDDLAINREILRAHLARFGIRSIEVADGAAALAALAAAETDGKAFDGVIIDRRLGADSGLALAQAIRARGGEAPRLILFSSGEGPDGPPPFRLFDAVLLKPVMPARLHEAVCHAFFGRKPQGEPLAELARGAPVLRVLVAEDNQVNQFVLTRILEGVGVEVALAANGEEALVRAAESKFDVILMDMQMPLMDGLEATRALRLGEGPNHATRIIGLTAAVGPVYERQCREAGMDDFLTKPIDKAALLNALPLTLDPAPLASRRGGP